MVNITFAGDLLCNARMNRAAEGDYHCFFKNAGKLKNCDYLVANLETAVAGEEQKYTYERYSFNTPAEFLDAVKDCGFDMLCLANNHCMDRGEQGLMNTLKHCKERGFDTVGVYACKQDREKIFIKELDGIRVAFINYTYGTNAFAHKNFLEHPYMINLLQPEETKEGSIHLLNGYEQIAEDVRRIYIGKSDEYAKAKPYLEQLERDIRSAKEQSDYVVMLLHCGSQYIETVDPYSKFIIDKIRGYGADIVIGNHQHIIQRCEKDGDWLAVNCLGNMLNDCRREGEDYWFDSPSYNAVVHLGLSKDASGKVTAEKSFSIYTTAFDKRGLPTIVDSFDIYEAHREAYMRSQILHYADLFAGKHYGEVRETYEL